MHSNKMGHPFPHKAIVAHIDAVSGWSDETLISCGETVTVWFFCENYSRMKRLRDRLPTSWIVASVGVLVNEIAQKFRHDLINLDRQIRRPEASSLTWHAGNVAERSPYASNFILQACRHIAIKEGLSQGGEHIIITDDVDVARVFLCSAQAMCADVRWMSPNKSYGLRDRLSIVMSYGHALAKGVRARLGGVYGLVKRLRQVRALRKSSPVPIEALRKCDVLIATWTRKDSFPAQERISEALSLGKLPEVIRAGGLRVGYVSLPMYWLDNYADIAQNSVDATDDLLLFEDTFDVSDVMVVAWASLFTFSAFKRKAVIAGYDVTAVLHHQAWREWEDWRPANARLFATIGRFLSKNKVQPDAVVHVYENHSWEKCLRLGMHQHLPQTFVVGCQQSPFSDLYVNFLPTQLDLHDGAAIDRLMVSGPRFRDVMIEMGYPQQSLFMIGGIRYREFFEIDRDALRRETRSSSGKILCATGSDANDCCELAVKVAEGALGLGDMTVIINFHPLMDTKFRESVISCVRSTGVPMDHVEFSDIGMQSLIDQVDAVFYSDTNSAFEAMSRGVPIVHVGREFALDYNKVPQKYSINVRSVVEIRQVLRDIAANKSAPWEQGTTWAGIKEALCEVDTGAIFDCIQKGS